MTMALNPIFEDIFRAHGMRVASDYSKIRQLASALEEIAGAHIPDNPAASGFDDLAWAQRHVAHLRRIALNALKVGTPASETTAPKSE